MLSLYTDCGTPARPGCVRTSSFLSYLPVWAGANLLYMSVVMMRMGGVLCNSPGWSGTQTTYYCEITASHTWWGRGGFYVTRPGKVMMSRGAYAASPKLCMWL